MRLWGCDEVISGTHSTSDRGRILQVAQSPPSWWSWRGWPAVHIRLSPRVLDTFLLIPADAKQNVQQSEFHFTVPLEVPVVRMVVVMTLIAYHEPSTVLL